MSDVDHAITQMEEAGFTLIFASRDDEAGDVVHDWGRLARSRTPVIKLDLDDLLTFPKLALPVVFFCRKTLWADDFQYSEFPQDNASRLEMVTVDLTSLEPKLWHFQKRLSEASEVEFFAPYNGLMVVCRIREAWYDEFLELRNLALCQAREQLAREAQAHREEQAAREQAALHPHEQRLRLLLDDSGFLKLARVKSTAQRTLMSYARERESEAVAALGEQRTKDLLTELRDRVLTGQAT